MTVTQRTMAAFLTPEGFSQPSVAAVLREGSVRHRGRSLRRPGLRRARRATSYALWLAPRRGSSEPVLLVPGFLAGDSSLGPMSRSLRHQGFRTYRADIRANVGCTLAAADAARGAARGDHPATRLAGADRRAQPRRDARPRCRRPSPRPRRRHRHDGQPDARARRPPRVAGPQRRPAGAAQPRRAAQPDGRGLRGRALRPGELRPGPRRAAGRASTSPRSTPGATASSTGGPASTRSPGRSRCARPTWAWRSTPRSSRPCRRRCARRPRRQLSKSIAERSRSFESWCSAVIERTVPLRERITSECVVTPSPR